MASKRNWNWKFAAQIIFAVFGNLIAVYEIWLVVHDIMRGSPNLIRKPSWAGSEI